MAKVESKMPRSTGKSGTRSLLLCATLNNGHLVGILKLMIIAQRVALTRGRGPEVAKLSPGAIWPSLSWTFPKTMLGPRGEQGEIPVFVGFRTGNFPEDGSIRESPEPLLVSNPLARRVNQSMVCDQVALHDSFATSGPRTGGRFERNGSRMGRASKWREELARRAPHPS